jgi:hypothetical protein
MSHTWNVAFELFDQGECVLDFSPNPSVAQQIPIILSKQIRQPKLFLATRALGGTYRSTCQMSAMGVARPLSKLSVSAGCRPACSMFRLNPERGQTAGLAALVHEVSWVSVENGFSLCPEDVLESPTKKEEDSCDIANLR